MPSKQAGKQASRQAGNHSDFPIPPTSKQAGRIAFKQTIDTLRQSGRQAGEVKEADRQWGPATKQASGKHFDRPTARQAGKQADMYRR